MNHKHEWRTHKVMIKSSSCADTKEVTIWVCSAENCKAKLGQREGPARRVREPPRPNPSAKRSKQNIYCDEEHKKLFRQRGKGRLRSRKAVAFITDERGRVKALCAIHHGAWELSRLASIRLAQLR